MITLHNQGVYITNRKNIIDEFSETGLSWNNQVITKEEAKKNTISYPILKKHNTSKDMNALKLKFDSMTSHDITFVGVIQTAKASGLKEFILPYVLTNCHNSLCAVGGTLNEDDHLFGLSAAKKYGGIYVPPHMAVIHQYMRELFAGCGQMILGSDSHTRYGALGTMAIGEGGGELVKQLLCKTYDIQYPEVIGVYLTGKPMPGVGPQDVALAIIRQVFKNSFVKNKVMEFFGDGIKNLSMDFRNGIDVMTTETACLTSIWETDQNTKEYFEIHGRPEQYKELSCGEVTYYDGLIVVDLSSIHPMIALPFHPSNAYEIKELYENLGDILRHTEIEAEKLIENTALNLKLTEKIVNGKLKVDQGVIAGCAGGTFENIIDATTLINGKSMGCDEFALSVYPSSQPVMIDLVKNGSITKLMNAGVTIRTAFCGPCFGAGDVPANQALSIRHTTRNFPNREGSKPRDGQIASVALMDARSIAATAINGGIVIPATDIDTKYTGIKYYFDKTAYDNRVYNGFGNPKSQKELTYGPNITDWPEIGALTDDILLRVCSVINDPVTTTDELIPSGDTATFRSNPLGLAEFTLSRKDPNYVGRAKKVLQFEKMRMAGIDPTEESKDLKEIFEKIKLVSAFENINPKTTGIGSVIYAVKPGDGSAREQAVSCQRVLGGSANIAVEYATKRYRSNLINWGMIPFILAQGPPFKEDDYILIADIKKAIQDKNEEVKAYIVTDNMREFNLSIGELTDSERQIIQDGCLINHYSK